jgi:hypothetical protein
VTAEPAGTVLAGGKRLAVLAPGKWSHLEVCFAYGADAPKTCEIRLGARDGEIKTVSDVPFASDRFTACTWFGISSLSNEKAAYYLDNVKLTIEDGPE